MRRYTGAIGRFVLVLLALSALATEAEAQRTFEAVGSRALGMGGAFVGVADDPSAVFWNPAGLASGQPAGATVEWIRFHRGDREAVPATGPWQRSAKFVSLGTWPIGLSYATFNDTLLFQDNEGALQTQRFSTKYWGATILQTLTEGLVVGTTLKYVRGTVAEGPAAGGNTAEALDAGGDRDGKTSGAFDLDLSAMIDARVFRLGWTTRNLRSPRFEGTAGNSIELERQSRMGLAILPADGLTFAVDLDMNTVELPIGRHRMLALGAEHVVSPRFAVRGGARWNLKGDRTTVGTVGASLALKPGAWLDGHYTRGRAHGETGFGFALRAGW